MSDTTQEKTETQEQVPTNPAEKKTTKQIKEENAQRLERLKEVWASFKDRQIILAMRSVNVLKVQWDTRIPTACTD